jgi:uncharacterized membrane protein YdbT with pleckstrin-like domain
MSIIPRHSVCAVHLFQLWFTQVAVVVTGAMVPAAIESYKDAAWFMKSTTILDGVHRQLFVLS